MSGFVLSPVSRVVEGAKGPYRHVFGGTGWYSGTLPRGCVAPLHLLYIFDTNDPVFPVHIPGVRYLPLFYSFPYNAGACGYRVKSDSEIEVLYMETEEIEPDFPYEDYPKTFPQREVHLEPVSYEQHKALAFFLTAEEEALNEEDRRLIFKEFDYPFTQLGGIHRMWQDIPEVCCPNRDCPNNRHRSSSDVFAVIWNQPHKGVHLWEKPRKAEFPWEKDDDDPSDTQVIFQMCPSCHAIHACNRCT